MDETTGQGTFRLPRRLPKQPDQAFYPQESIPAPAEPPRPQTFAAEEFVPVFEMDPYVSEPEWPEFPPQEFTVTEEFHAPVRQFFAEEEVFAAPVREFIIPDVAEPPRRSYIAPVEPPPRPITAARPAPPPPQVPPEPESVRESSASESKPGVAPVGDPKPAFARPSGRSRSRPSRPSGGLPVAGASGAYPTAEITKATFIGDDSRRSGEFVSASVRTAEVALLSLTESPTAVGKSAPDASPSRVTKSARKRRASTSTVPSLIALSVLLVAYSFAVGPIEIYLESALVGSAGPSSALLTLVPWLSLIPVLLLLGGVLWIIAGLIGLRHVKPRTRKSRAGDTVSTRKRKKERRKSPLEQFREEAATEDIDGAAAYQAWRLLQPFGPDNHVLSIYDELEGTLGMRPKEIQSVYQQLTSAELHGERFHFRTVLDLLRIVKQASLSKA